MELRESKINYQNNELRYKFNALDPTMNKLIMTFDNNIYNSTNKLNNGEVNITFKNTNDLNEIIKLLDLFFREISKQKQVVPNLVVVFEINEKNQKEEQEIAQKIMNTANTQLKYEVVYKKDIAKTNQEENDKILKEQQQLQEQKEIVATGTKQIQKEDLNNKTQKYIEVDGQIYDDNDYLSINEKKQQLLQMWLNDPLKKELISNLTPEQLDMELTKDITMTQKQYDLSSPTHLNQNNDELANLSNQVAHKTDGKVNEELGIIENGAQHLNQFTTIEETRTNGYNVVIPTVNQQTVTGSNNNSTQTTNTSVNEYQENYEDSNYETSIYEEETEQREVGNIYYTDDMGTIYDSEGNELGKLGPETGYIIDANNNLTKDGEVIGTVENIRDMEQKKQKNNVRKKVLKPDGFTSFFMISMLASILLIIYIIITLY